MVESVSASLKSTLSSEEQFPTVLPVQLNMVRGPERLPADKKLKEMLKRKLCNLLVDSVEVNTLFLELSAHIHSINNEEQVIFVTFQTFEEIWKFSTYYTMGLVGHCIENLLFDDKLWLTSLGDHIAIDVSIQEETIDLIYKGILMQEGSLFGRCCSNQTFDSSTFGGDLYLKQGDLAHFEPPFLGSCWTVLRLADGARGTAPNATLEPVIPFHEWYLKSCAEDILLGDGKATCHFPTEFARGTCVATVEYHAEGPDELSLAPGDHIIIVGLLMSCFEWFTGKKISSGEVGLIKTSLVTQSTDSHDSVDIFLDVKDEMFFSVQEERVIKETISLLKKKSQNDMGHHYKLDVINQDSTQGRTPCILSGTSDIEHSDIKKNIQRILQEGNNTSPDSAVNLNSTLNEPVLSNAVKDPSLPCFSLHTLFQENHTHNWILSLLEAEDYNEEFGVLYRLSSEELASYSFSGYSEQDELIAFLKVARETARKRQLLWAQTRLCFLLGKLCAGSASQARVYFEEALCTPCDSSFPDLRLLASIYSNLATIYLLQNSTKSFFAISERLAALLMGIPDCLEILVDNSVLKYILKKAVLCHNKMAEAQACYLLAKHHWAHTEGPQTVPYLERLLVLYAECQKSWNISLSHGYLALGRLYSRLCLPHLSNSSARKASQLPSTTLSECLNSMLLVLENINKLIGVEAETCILPQVAPFLDQALSFTILQVQERPQCNALSHHLTVCLCQLFNKHKMVSQAISQMHSLINNRSLKVSIPVTEINSAVIWLAWLHINNNQPYFALNILDLVLSAMPEHCTNPQEGLIFNMRGVALRGMGDLQRAAVSYQTAVDICEEYDDLPNSAVAQANLGILCLKAGAAKLAHRHLTEAVKIFSQINEENHEANFITVLLELGQLYLKQHQMYNGKVCFEWALLLAVNANLLNCQLAATKQLCHLYMSESPDHSLCIFYNLHQVQLLRKAGERGQEGDALEAISQLYLTFGTKKMYLAALDYTKTSLGIFIDLGFRKKEAYGWLNAGKIYHLLGQTELVDLYFQVAQDVALKTGDTRFTLKLLEAAGDIFFNSSQNRDKAVSFYRDRALPIAVKTSCFHTRLRLSNKLTEVMLHLKLYGEAVEFAKSALDISISLGEHLNERVAYHRLASIYTRLDQYEMAEHYYLKTLSLCPSPLEFDEESQYYAMVYQKLGDIIFYKLKDPFDAAGYYHLALAAAMDLGNKRSQLQLCTHLATIYHNHLVDQELSLFFYQKARRFAAEINVKRITIVPDK